MEQTPSDKLNNNAKYGIITEKEYRLLGELRKINYGEVVIFMLNGKPDRIEKIRESIKL